jgi:hypothetical protein
VWPQASPTHAYSPSPPPLSKQEIKKSYTFGISSMYVSTYTF